MNKLLFDTYNAFKKQFISEMEKIMLPSKAISFAHYIRIMKPRTSDELFEEFTEMHWNEKEKCYYCHCFVTNSDLSTDEYWLPLTELSFDELYEIAERL